MELIFAIGIGCLFGFVLHRVGAANPQNIIEMLRLKDFHLMKVILFAIGLSCLAVFTLLRFGLLDAGHISVKTAHIGVLAGGAIFGAGFAIGGYCPGTSLCAAASGRRDAVFFVLGGLAGAFVFMLTYEFLDKTFMFNKIAGGKVTLADTGISKYPALITGFEPVVAAAAIAALFILMAFILPSARK